MLQLVKVLKIDAKLIFFSTSYSLYHRYAESSTPRLNDTGSRLLSLSTIRGVGDSPTQRYGESTTLRITDTASFLLKNSIADSPSRWLSVSPRYSEFSFKKYNSQLSISVMRGVVDSAYQWCGESSSPPFIELESRRLHISLIRRVADSPYRWDGESFFEYEYLREFEAKIATARNVV